MKPTGSAHSDLEVRFGRKQPGFEGCYLGNHIAQYSGGWKEIGTRHLDDHTSARQKCVRRISERVWEEYCEKFEWHHTES